jgi:aminopeptidase N
MSSYLLAFAVADFDYLDNSDTVAQRNETYQRIIVRPDGVSKAKYALDVSIKTLEALEGYVNYKYEINKLDSIGVPNKGGAMENW